MHIHVGHNHLGDLPDRDVGCLAGIEAAARYLAKELVRVQEDYLERCTEDCVQLGPARTCPCVSCQIADAVFADSRATSPVWHRLRTDQAWSQLYGPRNNPFLHVWALPAVGARQDCDHHHGP